MKRRQSIVEQVQEYLKFKRSCGYELEASGKELMLFARYAALVGHHGPLTTELTVRWAKLPQDADPCYWANRYHIVRRFAEYRFLFDPATEIPPKELLGPSKRRLSPHIYSQGEIASFLQALRRYRKLRDSYHPGTRLKTFFLSGKGTPLNYRGVLYIFLKLSRKLGWRDREKKPRIHDVRHTFAVRRLLKWYEEGANLDQKILAVSTYLGHAQVTDTYWYLSAVPELLAVVSDKFENFAGKERRRDNL